ncbi:uncharacterized protein TRAVEDRAFT_58638, partial [Trametes versicolor FP-101664 SS1]|uniref:uncharacterized protein n=1 Tax=Trametes versicolor (strain FP-101664) TaxID=717944 RepID=UPI0004621FCD
MRGAVSPIALGLPWPKRRYVRRTALHGNAPSVLPTLWGPRGGALGLCAGKHAPGHPRTGLGQPGPARGFLVVVAAKPWSRVAPSLWKPCAHRVCAFVRSRSSTASARGPLRAGGSRAHCGGVGMARLGTVPWLLLPYRNSEPRRRRRGEASV